ncbi:hypothetical protein LZ3411_0015 [Levilactobacillus zymae]|uniref:Uncharacterized protein n=1 Tax=Levilactobacillus zymae TaxID=267363 RepID=A0A1Y6JTA2_9LACO|nr:hypothetical protein LZ3411_0015 [Levilactobacillus zymae]
MKTITAVLVGKIGKWFDQKTRQRPFFEGKGVVGAHKKI